MSTTVQDALEYPGPDFTNEALMDLLGLVAGRGWRFNDMGHIVDAEGRCPLCALAQELDASINETRNARLAVAFLFNQGADQREMLRAEAMAAHTGRKTDDVWPYRRSLGERLGNITFSADCPLGMWRKELIAILKVDGDPEQARRKWEGW